MRNYFLYIALFLTILITVGSLIPPKNLVQVKVPSFDKIVHMGAYFLLALSWLIGSVKKQNKLIHAIAVAFLVVIYGIIIEALQLTITNARQGDMYDVIANSIGVLAALLFFTKVLKKNLINK